ncbi:hypothetical protein ACIQXF_19875 [Lysinibacillus sp. NPDC097231]|uniref:hypothetical protein n=1 Tax=Lysinibacillus sp. NPDC097231 TaxID=3364142 RepID=UPI0037FCA237
MIPTQLPLALRFAGILLANAGISFFFLLVSAGFASLPRVFFWRARVSLSSRVFSCQARVFSSLPRVFPWRARVFSSLPRVFS